MKLKNKIIALALAVGFSSAASGQLIITGVYDGQSSDPKGIEVFAVTAGDYNGWSIEVYANGSTSPFTDYDIGDDAGDDGIFGAGEYFYVTSTAATLTSWNWDTTKGDIYSDGNFNQNGDDAFRVTDGTNTIDVFGVIGTDGTGEPWEYTDSYSYRVDNTPASSSFNTANWTFGGVNVLDPPADQQTILTNQFGTYAVPEPEFYGALVGVLAIGIAVYRRRQNRA